MNEIVEIPVWVFLFQCIAAPLGALIAVLFGEWLYRRQMRANKTR